ncbi:aminotransferase class I/II-fold pyridoxal phosphate-dependent enzyme [Actinomadura fibrosa]|uniref:Aminotransferase class I/II-fold pyridoxal phosphate-dependent enzyme n=1 Tax=Actinomadura fibrosa TaxID=111802 RepID=A0ABW2XUD5_9ACTN|nr:aminotransferase class I/II-fold pyridoxal phosphate-dependent enzyme [Actinomadura fibrosa]
MTARKLTTLENRAIAHGLNVSDGHPRMPLTRGQRAIVAELGDLFDQAAKRPFHEIEEEAHRSFLHGLGQHAAPVGTGRLVTCYSSSVAMDITARALAERTGSVALVHPTFDNIPDLLRARRLHLVPVPEHRFEEGLGELPPEVGAVFVTTPNNPTGWVLGAEPLARLAAWCAGTGRVLAMDTCFRGQDTRAQYDTYRILEDSGAEWVVIEDTGKLWPMQELKAGFLAWGEGTRLELAEAFDDVLLSVSPVVLLLITRLAHDAVDGGYAELARLLAENRRTLAETIDSTGLVLKEPDSRISVAQLELPESIGSATDFYDRLVEHNVHVLPCEAFHWARNTDGGRDVRVALARAPEEVRAAAAMLAEVSVRMRADGRR